MNKIKLLDYFLLFLVSVIIFGCSSAEKSSISTEDPEDAFRQAKLIYDNKDYAQAIEDFSFIKIKFSGTGIIDKAQFYLGMSYFMRKEYVLAAYEFENLIKNYSSSSFVGEARYYLAMSYYELSPDYYLDQTYTKYAIIEFQNFIILFPSDKLVSQAELKIRELRNKLAFKDLNSAELYVRMDNYKAALVYYENILNEYFDTEYADDASYGKITTLIRKKLFEAAKKEIEKFEKKYRNSEYFNSVIKLKKSL